MNQMYEAQVQSVYQRTLSTHTAGFVLTWVIMLGYLWFILKPYLTETANESKRIAELLTQLPPDVDVEGLLRSSLMAGQAAKSNNNNKGGWVGSGVLARVLLPN